MCYEGFAKAVYLNLINPLIKTITWWDQICDKHDLSGYHDENPSVCYMKIIRKHINNYLNKLMWLDM